MSGHWEAEQYKEQLEASRTAHAACEAARREGLAENARLRAELAESKAKREEWMDWAETVRPQYDELVASHEVLRARLSAVVALWDGPFDDPLDYHGCTVNAIEVRAAATGKQ